MDLNLSATRHRTNPGNLVIQPQTQMTARNTPISAPPSSSNYGYPLTSDRTGRRAPQQNTILASTQNNAQAATQTSSQSTTQNTAQQFTAHQPAIQPRSLKRPSDSDSSNAPKRVKIEPETAQSIVPAALQVPATTSSAPLPPRQNNNANNNSSTFTFQQVKIEPKL